MVSLNNLKPKYGSVHKKKRLGTGQGSGHGQTSTRGQKGQSSTSGGAKPIGFEGGQMPLLRRIPKSGFNNDKFRKEYECVNISILSKNFSNNEEINREKLIAKGLVKRNLPVKILGDGEISKPLNIHADAFSKSAKEKIEKAGGKVILEK
jgi:large subunit ribosomal protein L15